MSCRGPSGDYVTAPGGAIPFSCSEPPQRFDTLPCASNVDGTTGPPRVRRRARNLGVGLISGCADDEQTADNLPSPAGEEVSTRTGAALARVTFDVRRDPGCACCTSWVEYLQTHGATVELAEDDDRESLRAERGISDEAASCHTGIVEGYAIEGHVPLRAI